MNSSFQLRALWLAALVVLPVLVAPVGTTAANHAGGANVLDGCTDITQSGVYHVSNNFTVGNETTPCLEVRADNVTIDGRNQTVIGPENDTGAFVGNPQRGPANLTIRNLTLSQWGTGIILSRTDNATVESVVVENATNGIILSKATTPDGIVRSTATTVSDSQFANITTGIKDDGSRDTLIDRVQFAGSIHAAVESDNALELTIRNSTFDGISTGVKAENATIERSTFREVGQGVDLLSRNGTTVRNNTFTGVWAAVTLDQVSNVTVANNTITDAGDFGLRMVYVRNSTVRNNVIENASRYGVRIRLGINDTVIINNTIRNSGQGQFRVGPSLSDSRVDQLHLPNMTFARVEGNAFEFVPLGDVPNDPSEAENVSLYANVSAVRNDATANLTLAYNGSRVDESNLTVWRYSEGDWVNETPNASIDTGNDTIRVDLTEFSVLAPMELTDSSSSDDGSDTGEGGGSGGGGSDTGSGSTATATPSPTLTPTASPTPTPTATSAPTPTVTATEVGTRTATPTRTTSAADTAVTTTSEAATTSAADTQTPGQPGFGMVVALLAVLLALALRRRR